MLENLTMLKKQLLDFSDELQNVSYIDKKLISNSDLDRDSKKLRDGTFRIALVSSFSAGKSTFINALLGVDILGMDERAYTATVTRLKYMPEIYLEIIYNNGKKDVISGTYKGQKLTTANVDLIKNILEEKTTVLGKGEEEKVKEAILGYPFELCKNGVEIIDTPGLGARYENHERITKDLLLEVDAVVFLFAPDKIDEREFIDTIRSYVGHAFTSKLEENGKHVFLLMNKFDRVESEKEVKRLLNGIKDVLDGIINQADPIGVSAYYGLKARMFNNGYIDLTNIQKDRKISIPDPEDPEMPIAGKAIKEEHVNNILNYSKILDTEIRLGKYLEGTVKTFVDSFKRTMDNIVKNNIQQYEAELNNLRTVSISGEAVHNELIQKLKEEIENLESKGIEKITKYIMKITKGGTSGEGSIVVDIEKTISKEYGEITRETIQAIHEKWDTERDNISNQSTAYNVLDDLLKGAMDWLNVYAKKFAQEVFLDIKQRVEKLNMDIDEEYLKMMAEIDTSTKQVLGNSLNDAANSRMKGLDGIIQTALGKEFASIISTVSNDIEDEIIKRAEESTYLEKKTELVPTLKRGVNTVVGWFKKNPVYETFETHVNRFDIEDFKKSIDGLVEWISKTIDNSLVGQELFIFNKVMEAVSEIFNGVQKESVKIIKEEIQIRKDMLDKQILSYGSEHEKREKRMTEIDEYTKKSKKLLHKFLGIRQMASR